MDTRRKGSVARTPLEQLVRDKGVKLKDIMAVCGVSKKTALKWLGGAGNPDFKGLARAIGVDDETVSGFFGEEKVTTQGKVTASEKVTPSEKVTTKWWHLLLTTPAEEIERVDKGDPEWMTGPYGNTPMEYQYLATPKYLEDAIIELQAKTGCSNISCMRVSPNGEVWRVTVDLNRL